MLEPGEYNILSTCKAVELQISSERTQKQPSTWPPISGGQVLVSKFPRDAMTLGQIVAHERISELFLTGGLSGAPSPSSVCIRRVNAA